MNDDLLLNIFMEKRFIHMWWVIGLLVVLLITSIGLGIYRKVVDANVVIDLISFISSLLSIVLSVFAIFYSQKEMVCELHKRNLRVRSDSNSSL